MLGLSSHLYCSSRAFAFHHGGFTNSNCLGDRMKNLFDLQAKYEIMNVTGLFRKHPLQSKLKCPMTKTLTFILIIDSLLHISSTKHSIAQVRPVLLLAETISMPVQEVEVILATAMPLGISELTLGIIVALVFGGFVFCIIYGKQCCDSIIWIIETLKMNIGEGAGEKRERSNAESSFEELSKEEIVNIKRQISRVSQQIRAILAEIKQIRKTAGKKALEYSIETASTEYAMKFELKRPEFEKAMKILKAALAEIPEEGVAYKQKVMKWIVKAQEKFEDYSPENFSKKIEAIKARRRAAQSKQARGKQNTKDFSF